MASHVQFYRDKTLDAYPAYPSCKISEFLDNGKVSESSPTSFGAATSGKLGFHKQDHRLSNTDADIEEASSRPSTVAGRSLFVTIPRYAIKRSGKSGSYPESRGKRPEPPAPHLFDENVIDGWEYSSSDDHETGVFPAPRPISFAHRAASASNVTAATHAPSRTQNPSNGLSYVTGRMRMANSEPSLATRRSSGNQSVSESELCERQQQGRKVITANTTSAAHVLKVRAQGFCDWKEQSIQRQDSRFSHSLQGRNDEKRAQKKMRAERKNHLTTPGMFELRKMDSRRTAPHEGMLESRKPTAKHGHHEAQSPLVEPGPPDRCISPCSSDFSADVGYSGDLGRWQQRLGVLSADEDAGNDKGNVTASEVLRDRRMHEIFTARGRHKKSPVLAW